MLQATETLTLKSLEHHTAPAVGRALQPTSPVRIAIEAHHAARVAHHKTIDELDGRFNKRGEKAADARRTAACHTESDASMRLVKTPIGSLGEALAAIDYFLSADVHNGDVDGGAKTLLANIREFLDDGSGPRTTRDRFGDLESDVCNLRNMAGIAETVVHDLFDEKPTERRGQFAVHLLSDQAIDELLFSAMHLRDMATQLKDEFYLAMHASRDAR
jgi:hypothetical protein